MSLKQFKIHLEQLNYLFSSHNNDGKKEMLKKESGDLKISNWENISNDIKNKYEILKDTINKNDEILNNKIRMEYTNNYNLNQAMLHHNKKKKKKHSHNNNNNNNNEKIIKEPKQRYPKWNDTLNMRQFLLQLVFFDETILKPNYKRY